MTHRRFRLLSAIRQLEEADEYFLITINKNREYPLSYTIESTDTPPAEMARRALRLQKGMITQSTANEEDKKKRKRSELILNAPKRVVPGD